MTITATDLRVQADSYRQTVSTIGVADIRNRYLDWIAGLEARADAMDAEAKAERKLAAKSAHAAAKSAPVEQHDDAGLWS